MQLRNLLLPLCVGLMVLAACAGIQQGAGGASTVLNAAAPLLPPPFGLLAGGVATLLSGVAAVGANKASNEAFKKDKKPHPSPLIRLWTDHSSSLMGGLLTAVMTLRASGLIHMSDTELALLTTTLAAPVGTKKVMRR